MLSVSQECQQHAVTVAALAGDPLKRIFGMLDTEAICYAVQVSVVQHVRSLKRLQSSCHRIFAGL